MPASSGADQRRSETDAPPRLADGLELIGEYEGSGFKEPPFLARRGDGQVLQLPKLLYLVASRADGRANYDQIAKAVTEEFGRGVSAENVQYLAETKLRPLGVLTAPDGSSPKLARPNPLLALNFRTAVVPPALVNAVTTVFRPLFWPLIVVPAVAGFFALDYWLFFVHGISQGLRGILNEPVFFLILFGIVVISAAFHECGHASACRYGGARPGVMGAGMYFVWPAFYTDVTDAYRLGKAGRLRTDLGGVYFNALFMLVTLGVYLVTHQEVLIVVMLLLQFEMVHQFLPFLRLDGYYVLADLTGIPDVFSRIKPVLASFLPWRKPDRQVTELKTWARVVVTIWVVFTVAFILYIYGVMLLHLPQIAATAAQSMLALAGKTWSAFQASQVGTGLFQTLQLVLLGLPILGMGIVLVRLVYSLIRLNWTRTRGRPLHRATGFTVMLAAFSLLLVAWIPPQAQYRIISPHDRGTVPETFADASTVLAPVWSPVQSAVGGVSRLLTGAPVASPAASPAASPTTAASPSDSSAAPSPSASPSASPTPDATPAPSPATTP